MIFGTAMFNLLKGGSTHGLCKEDTAVFSLNRKNPSHTPKSYNSCYKYHQKAVPLILGNPA